MIKISVIMSTYNEELNLLRKSIDSILNQTMKDFEFIIIMDNPKNGEICDILYSYEKLDNRIKVIRNEKNLGLAESLNRGINIANGKYIARMDADDVSLLDRFEKQYKYLEEHPNIDLVSGNLIVIDENDKEISKTIFTNSTLNDVNRLMPYFNVVSHPSIMMRTSVLKSLNGYRNFPAAQDYDLWLRMITANYKIVILNDFFIKYRSYNNNISHSKAFKQFCCGQYIIKMYKERKRYGIDKFSVDGLNKYLKKMKADSKKENKKFLKSLDKFNEAIRDIKEHKYFNGIMKIFYLILRYRYIVIVAYRTKKAMNVKKQLIL